MGALGDKLDPCVVEAGTTVEVLRGQFLRFPDGQVVDHHDCIFEPGSAMVIYYEAHKPPPTKSVKMPQPSTNPGHSLPVTAVPTPAGGANLPPEIPDAMTTAPTTSGELADITGGDLAAVTEAAGGINTEYGAMLALMLAVLTIMGGTKAWRYYSQRAEQRHELEMKKLELGGASPPPCQAAHAKLEVRLAAVEQALDAAGRERTRLSGAGVNQGDTLEDLDERLVRLSKKVKRLKGVVEGISTS